MTNTEAASDARIALDSTVACLNLERFCKLFTEKAYQAAYACAFDC